MVNDRAERLRLLLAADVPSLVSWTPECWHVDGKPTTDAQVDCLHAVEPDDIELYAAVREAESQLLDVELAALSRIGHWLGPAVRRRKCTIDEALRFVFPQGPTRPMTEIDELHNQMELWMRAVHWFHPPVDRMPS